jgi:hypothetical protein
VGRPHCEQNLAVGESWLPQSAQTGARAKAHSSQNLAPALFSCWQPGQIIQDSKKIEQNRAKSSKRKMRQSKVASGATANKSVFRASLGWRNAALRPAGDDTRSD